MVQNLYTKIAFIVVLVILAVWVLFTKEITLGLDLRGGSSLRYKLPKPEDAAGADMSHIVRETIEVFRKRIDTVGLKEIPIRAQGEDEILIDLPGMSQSEVDSIVKIIESQGHLEWFLAAETEHDTRAQDKVYVDVEEQTRRLVEFLKKEEAESEGWDLETDVSPLDLNMTINEKEVLYRWYPVSERRLESNGFVVPPSGSTFESLKSGAALTDEQIASRYFTLLKVFKDPAWRFTGADLLRVRADIAEGLPVVGFEFKPERTADFAAFTKAHVKKPLAIVLDGYVDSTPIIQQELPGSGIIQGPMPKGFTQQERNDLLTVLQSGSIVVKPILQSLHNIGPTLGENSIRRGQMAAVLSIACVFVFSIVYYFLAGLVACVSLSLNLLLLMAGIVFLEATLTLPGIAGLVLTFGMAIDANILIYERIREERDKGKTLAQSVKNGFERAFLTIVDSNATTFITAAILYSTGTGPIKGFAITLMYGIITTLFSALFICKVIFAALLDKGLKKLTMLRMFASANIDFLRLRRQAAFFSVLLIAAGLVLFFMQDESKYGLDFTGGYNVHMVTTEQTTQAEVQTALGAVFPNVQVITVKGNIGAEDMPGRVFDVKIKGTALPPPSGEGNLNLGEEVSIQDRYLEAIKETLGDRLLPAPITNVSVTANPETERTTVKATLHFLDPPATEAQRATLSGDELTQAYYSNIEKALDGFVELEAGMTVLQDDGRTVLLAAEYTRAGAVTPQRIEAGLTQRLKEAAERGLPFRLANPFPVTDYIGPAVGVELRDKAIIAIFLSLVAIVVYIRLRFKEYKYGIGASVALLHDVLITLGAVSLARMLGIVDVEIDLPIIAAFLTIIGYSLNDTIVVFDRIRENLPRVSRPFGEVLNMSINQTLSRTILTGGTTIFSMVVLFVLNYGQRNVMEGFSFAMIVGVVVGTYSSIFVASPVVLALHLREKKLAERAP